MPTINALDRIMRSAVAAGVFPGAVLLASRQGRVRHRGAYGQTRLGGGAAVTTDTVFDLASLTKPLATALAVMELVGDGRLALDQPLERWLPGLGRGPRRGITVGRTLCHQGGLPAYRPYYRVLARLPADRRRPALRKMLAAEPLGGPPGRRTVYSDLGYMLLDWLVETVSGRRLDRFVARQVYRPLGPGVAEGLFFLPGGAPRPAGPIAATEQCPWRGRLLAGEVHDENAWVVGGVAGHAGLFGTAHGVHGLLGALLGAYNGTAVAPGWNTATVRSFLTVPPGATRTPGFDVPARSGSAAGSRFSAQSVGHLGYTGTSFWMDLTRGVIAVLLTNRVHPSRRNTRIRSFRPRLHDALMEALIQ